MFPYLIIECDDELPSEDERPFLVAGLIAVFTREEEPFPFGIDFIGVPSEGEEYQLPAAIGPQRASHTPSRSPRVHSDTSTNCSICFFIPNSNSGRML
jgi:hypothetical protein